MKRPWRAVGVITALALWCASLPAWPAGKVDHLLKDLWIVPLAPTAAPPFAARTLTDTAVSLADFRGRPVLLYFWATW